MSCNSRLYQQLFFFKSSWGNWNKYSLYRRNQTLRVAIWKALFPLPFLPVSYLEQPNILFSSSDLGFFQVYALSLQWPLVYLLPLYALNSLNTYYLPYVFLHRRTVWNSMSQQIKGSGDSRLLSYCDAARGVLCPVTSPSAQERSWQVGVTPVGDQQVDQGPRAVDVQIEAESRVCSAWRRWGI